MIASVRSRSVDSHMPERCLVSRPNRIAYFKFQTFKLHDYVFQYPTTLTNLGTQLGNLFLFGFVLAISDDDELHDGELFGGVFDSLVARDDVGWERSASSRWVEQWGSTSSSPSSPSHPLVSSFQLIEADLRPLHDLRDRALGLEEEGHPLDVRSGRGTPCDGRVPSCTIDTTFLPGSTERKAFGTRARGGEETFFSNHETLSIPETRKPRRLLALVCPFFRPSSWNVSRSSRMFFHSFNPTTPNHPTNKKKHTKKKRESEKKTQGIGQGQERNPSEEPREPKPKSKETCPMESWRWIK